MENNEFSSVVVEELGEEFVCAVECADLSWCMNNGCGCTCHD
jgi:hypothetical protein